MRQQLDPIRAAAAVEQVRTARMIQYRCEPFSVRVWELCSNLTVYAAWYVALAEWLETDLLTADERLKRAGGPHCAVRHLTDSA